MSEYSNNFKEFKEFLNKRIRISFSIFNVPKDSHILDAGCGFGDRMKAMIDDGYENVYGIDPDPECIGGTNLPNIQQGSITSTPFQASSFHCVLVEGVFHHISDYDKALVEISRILKPEGCLCIIEPGNSMMRKLLDFVTFRTPVPHILGGPWLLRKKIVGEEISTGYYPLWLHSIDSFFEIVSNYFRIDFCKKDNFFVYCKAIKV